MIAIAEAHAEDFGIVILQYPGLPARYEVVVEHCGDPVRKTDCKTEDAARSLWKQQVEKYLPDHAKSFFAQATVSAFTADDADERDPDTCYCSTTHPPCSFCTSLDEEEYDVYAEGGSKLLRQYRNAKETGAPWPPYSDNPLYGAF